MVAELIIKRILIDGAILTAIAVLVLTLYINPRIALSDYPEDVQAAGAGDCCGIAGTGSDLFVLGGAQSCP